NRGFSSVGDLALLLHGGPDLAGCLAPDLTVFSGQVAIDIPTASTSLREAAKRAGLITTDESVVAHTSPASGHAIESGAVFELNLKSQDGLSGRVSSRRLIMRFTGSASAPFAILWRGSIPSDDDAAAACARLAQAGS